MQAELSHTVRQEDSLESAIINSMMKRDYRFYLVVAGLLVVIGAGGLAYSYQLTYGLQVTAMRDVAFFGLYITNFVFFIGISHAGTLISAILRVTGAEWRRPITRMAEAITVVALLVAAPMIIVDVGRPERVLNVIIHGRIQSPILWDVISIATYLFGSVLYFYLPLVPDMARLRDSQIDLPRWRRTLYRILAVGWHGDEKQEQRLNKAISIMAILIIMVAVSVHTVVSWIFSMTLRPGWRSTIFGPYFVIGAIFSGVAAIIIAMAILRKVFHLEEYIDQKHFRNLGALLLVMDIIYVYFTLSEYLTTAYTSASADVPVLQSLFTGEFAIPFWSMVIGGFLLPGALLFLALVGRAKPQAMPQLRLSPRLVAAMAMLAVAIVGYQFLGSQALLQTTPDLAQIALRLAPLGFMVTLVVIVTRVLRHRLIASTVVASILINIAMWVKRYVIIIPTIVNPFMPVQAVPSEWAHYSPTWIEWSITAAGFATFFLLYIIFTKLFPVVSVWEVQEGKESTIR